MNREIKFRAWDKYKKVFIPNEVWAVVTTDFNAFGIILIDWENYKEGEYFYSNSQVLSQYTGLKDKNGKEIYEGDICSVDGGENIYEIIFYMGGFMVAVLPRKIRIYHIGNSLFNNIEIIGNIHENPELLK